MNRYIIITILLFSFSVSYAQDYIDEDTSYYSPMFERDTNARLHVGVKVGALMQGVVLKANTDLFYTDSINSWNSENQLGFLFGIAFDIRLSTRTSLSTGLDFAISGIKMTGEQNGLSFEDKSNYSTMQIPAWLYFAPKIAPKRFHISGGATFTADISKQIVRYNRLVQLNSLNMMVGLGFGYRVQLPTKANLNFDVQLHYGLANLVSNDDNFYNNSMDTMNLWELIFFVSLN